MLEQLVAQIERDFDLATPASVFASASLMGPRVRSTRATRRSIVSLDAKARRPQRRHHRAAAKTLVVLPRLGLKPARGVEEPLELVDLEERPLRTDALQDPHRASANAHRVAIDQLVVYGLAAGFCPSSVIIALIDVFESGRRQR